MSRYHDALRRLETRKTPERQHLSQAEIFSEGLDDSHLCLAESARHLKVLVRPASHIVVDVTRNHPVREQFRFLEHRLRRLGETSGMKRVLVTSSTPKEGKTVVAANLAVTLACSSSRVLLVDADMRGPGSQALYGLTDQPGLAEILEERVSLSEALLYFEGLSIYYLPSGIPSSSPLDLLNGDRIKGLFALFDEFDWVVVDSPPINAFADALSLASQVDSVVLVARSGMTHKQDLEESLAALKDSKIAGVVLNAHDSERKRDSYYSYYSGGPK